MNKYTKGPWIRDDDPWRVIRDGDGGLLMGDETYYPFNSYNDADWDLIAAAPEMFEALTALLERHTDLVESGDCGFWDAEKEEEVTKARAALAKARGE